MASSYLIKTTILLDAELKASVL